VNWLPDSQGTAVPQAKKNQHEEGDASHRKPHQEGWVAKEDFFCYLRVGRRAKLAEKSAGVNGNSNFLELIKRVNQKKRKTPQKGCKPTRPNCGRGAAPYRGYYRDTTFGSGQLERKG